MKTYDDDELAEAALLLGHHLTHEMPAGAPAQMPAALEKKLLEQGRAIAAETRYTTTKAAAVALEAEPEPENVRELRPATSLRAWGGWFAAAAAVGALVYGLRHRAPPPTPAARPDLVAVDARGVTVAEVSIRGASGVELVVHALAASAAGEHYRIWLSGAGPNEAAPAGSFRCTSGCDGQRFSGTWTKAGPIQSIWITRSKESEPWTLPERKLILAEAHRGTL